MKTNFELFIETIEKYKYELYNKNKHDIINVYAREKNKHRNKIYIDTINNFLQKNTLYAIEKTINEKNPEEFAKFLKNIENSIANKLNKKKEN